MIKVIHCTVNGKVREIAVDERESLTDMLRLRLGLTSVKKGCGRRVRRLYGADRRCGQKQLHSAGRLGRWP